jgi:hypothetical protein
MILDYYGIDTMPISVYSQLSTNYQILRYSQSIASQAAVCELVTVLFSIATLHQIFKASQTKPWVGSNL